MTGVKIVTDSTAYLSNETREMLDVEIVSLTVNFENESFSEIECNDYKDFYERLRLSSSLPTTSQPPVGDFLEIYEKVVNSGKNLISIHLSAGISGTVRAAQTAAQMLPGLDIAVVDSRYTSIGLYFIVEAAARAAQAGMKKDEILEIVEYVRDHIVLRFFPDTLEYLRRGGRIGGAAALIGSLLQIKPVLYFNNDGVIDVFEKVRTREKAIRRLFDVLKENVGEGSCVRAGVVHVGAPDEAEQLARRVAQELHGLEVEICPVGPVIGAHIGPGTLGICFYPLTPELKSLLQRN